MSQPRPRATIHPYDKKSLIQDLEQSKAKVEEAIEEFESKLQEWRSTVIPKFIEAVNAYDPASKDYEASHFRSGDFSPPIRPDTCKDFRVVNLTKAIARLSAMADEDGIVRLSSTEPILTEYLAYASCL